MAGLGSHLCNHPRSSITRGKCGPAWSPEPTFPVKWSILKSFAGLLVRLGSLQPEAAYSLTRRVCLPLVWASDVGVITGGRDKRAAARGAEG